MILDLDPDLRLHTRLALGRGWRLALSLAAWTAGIVWLTLDPHLFIPFNSPSRVRPVDPGYLQLALLFLMFAPSRTVARLLDLERGGRLDQTRLCGRPPGRTLLAFLIGSTWPYVFVSALFLINHVRLQGEPGSVLLALIVFGGALDVSLLLYGTLPPVTIGDSRFISPLLAILAVVSLYGLGQIEWVRHFAFDAPAARITIAIVVATLPAVVWLAQRRIIRPPQQLSRAGASSWMETLSRLVPRAGPAEFSRQLRCTLLSGGTLVTIVLAPIMVLAMSGSWLEPATDPRPLLLNLLPYLVVVIGAFAVSSTVRREIESSTVELARLTPQSAEAIAVSWYAGIALPFWIATLIAFATAWIVKRDALVFSWWLPAAALALPAVALAEGLQRRKPGVYLWLPLPIVMPLIALPREMFPQTPWNLNLRPMIVAFGTAAALGAAAGRLRRPSGPSLAGAAGIAAVVAFVLAARLVGRAPFPHVIVGLLAMAAVFAAEERQLRTAPWGRVGLLGGAALAAAAVLARQDGMLWAPSLVTGLGAALGLGIGILVHEVTWSVPLMSLALRAGVLAATEKWYWSELGTRLRRFGRVTGNTMFFAPTRVEITVAVALFILAAFVHTHQRMKSRSAALSETRSAALSSLGKLRMP